MYKPGQELVHIYEAHSMHMMMQYSLITKSCGGNHVGVITWANVKHMGPMQAGRDSSTY